MPVIGREIADALHGCEIAGHQGEGLLAAAFAIAQAFDGGIAGGIAGEVEAAQSLDRDDLSVAQALLRFGDFRRKGGSAGRAGVGLGVKAPVARIVVLRLASRAQAEGAHGGLGAVIRDVLDDGVARAAVGAVGEGVTVAPVSGIGEFAQAIRTSGHIRGNQGELSFLCEAFADFKAGVAARGQVCHSHLLDVRERRDLAPQPLQEDVESTTASFDFDDQT